MTTTPNEKDKSNEAAAVARVLPEEDNENYTLKIELDAEELQCRARFVSKISGDWFTPETLEGRLQELGVTEGLLATQVGVFCRSMGQGKNLENVLLAEGRLPEPGPDGWLEFMVRVTSTEIRLNEEDDGGTVDMKALNFFSNVVPDDLIACVHPPENGEAGLTVTGNMILPLLGKPVEVSAGEGVRVEEDGAKFYAELPGRVVHEGGVLSVSEDYTVNGDVNFEVGSINFIGRADIRGDVLDEFDVIATKGITVTGTVGACRIESDADITIGSMAGKGVGQIRCGGNLTARYLNEVHVECEGDVKVSTEIRNSIIKAGGQVLLENGTVSGGECVALAGIEAKALGSVMGVRTELISGVYFREVDRLKYLNVRHASVQEQIRRITDTLGPLAKKKVGKSLEAAIKKRVRVLTNRLEELSEEQEAIATERQTFTHQEHAAANPKVNAKSSVHEGVVISLGAVTEEISSEHAGPLSIIENTVEPGLRFLSLSALQVSADKLEAELLSQDSPA